MPITTGSHKDKGSFRMNSANRFVWALIAQASLFPAAASAATIVDTGPSPNIGPADPGLTIDAGQFLAGEFTTTQAYDITSLSAFVRQFAACACDQLTANFHLGLATGPTTASGSTFTDLFSLPVSFTAAPGAADWATASVPNYFLAAGTYWIVASATLADSPIGLGMPFGVPNPLSAYASTTGSPNNWQPLNPTLGFQVEGDPVSTVPLPGTLWLLASGIGALATIRRRRRV
jgi:PEP-CTERM motif